MDPRSSGPVKSRSFARVKSHNRSCSKPSGALGAEAHLASSGPPRDAATQDSGPWAGHDDAQGRRDAGVAEVARWPGANSPIGQRWQTPTCGTREMTQQNIQNSKTQVGKRTERAVERALRERSTIFASRLLTKATQRGHRRWPSPMATPKIDEDR